MYFFFKNRGFKDTHTAELMLQRAKKLKYNSQRKKKLSQLGMVASVFFITKIVLSSQMKLIWTYNIYSFYDFSSDPRQKLALFRKLEESRHLRPVQPPARKGVVRKEYFQGMCLKLHIKIE